MTVASADPVEVHTCSKCRQTKPVDHFKVYSAGRGRRSSHCRTCSAKYTAASTAMRLAEEKRLGAVARLCNHCKVEKALELFNPQMWECKECLTERRHKSRARDPLFYRRSMLRIYYKMTHEEYDRRLEEQGGVCAVCRKPPGKSFLHVDHDHGCCPAKKTCGRCVRGLLCFGCNSKVGLLESESEYAQRLREYAGVTVVKQ